jgi:hypothetical protein
MVNTNRIDMTKDEINYQAEFYYNLNPYPKVKPEIKRAFRKGAEWVKERSDAYWKDKLIKEDEIAVVLLNPNK